MTSVPQLRDLFAQRLRSTTIFARIAIGNAAVIVFGAIAGTLLTRHLTDVAADIWLIFLFATLGIALSVGVNFWIIRTALKPLQELRHLVDGIQAGTKTVENLKLTNPDPDLDLLANALESLIRQLESSNRRLRMLSERAINAQEEERKRIARSLHDDTGQAISMLIINLERLENRLEGEGSEIKDQVERARRLAASTLAELRKIISGLRPSILDDLGLIPAIRWYARTNLEVAGIKVDIDAPEDEIELSGSLKTTLFRITQEAVNNVIRHAEAQNASICLTKNKKKVYLRIEDDGLGLKIRDIASDAAKHQHWGLIGMQERVDLIGGEFHVSSKPGGGTRIEVSAPLIYKNEFVDG